jgi:hypothetical protein
VGFLSRWSFEHRAEVGGQRFAVWVGIGVAGLKLVES